MDLHAGPVAMPDQEDQDPPALVSSSAGMHVRLADTETLNQLAKIVLAVVPALTVALAAVGSATGGLARLFRDRTDTARASIALIFLAFALAALASRSAERSGVLGSIAGGRPRRRAGLLLLSSAVFVASVAWAFDAQISVMGRGVAPVVTGAITVKGSGASMDVHVLAVGVKSSNRIVVFAFESSDEKGDTESGKVPLYYSRSGPDENGRLDMHVVVDVPGTRLNKYPYVFVTAVLGEDQRDCDGVLLQGKGPLKLPNETACLTLQRPGALPPELSPHQLN
jgi:hypothetical protein